MPAYTPNSNIPYPLGTDPIRGTLADNIRVDMQQLAEGADAGDVATKAAAVAQTKTELQPRFAMVEELAAEPGSHVENVILDPVPVDAPSTWTAGNATLQQATIWGRAIATGGLGVSVRPNLGTGAEMYEPVSTGDPVGATIIIRAMSTQTITANLHIRGWSWDGASFTFVSTIASSGQKNIAPDVASTFTASGSVPSGVTHVDMYFTFTRLGQTYPSAVDFVYFRNAALFAGTVPDPLAYSDGSSEYSYWTGVPGASTSISMKPKSGGGGGAEAHAALLDDFTQRRGGVKHIGPRTSISFRIDHGLANFDAKMRAKLESLGFPYALALGSRDWGASENAGITPTIVNGWVAPGRAEIWSHSIGHADADTPAKIREYITESRKELERDMPAAKVDGYMPPGAGGTRYMGFGPSDTPQKFFETLAGQTILQTYAVTGGNMATYRVQDGTPRIGQSYFNMDTFDTAGVMSRVNTAISEGKGIQLMIHPSLIDTGGITTAQLHAALDQIKALQDQGKVIVMSAYDQMLADSTVPYKVSQTAGRTVTVWDYLNNREQLIYGDTGWRKVDATLPVGITASNVWLRRQGSEVTINVQNLRAETVGTVTVYNAPLGYRPDAPSVRSGVFASSAGTARIVSPFSGNVRVLSMGAGESLDGSITFTTTEPWPTSLPGVAA